VRIVAGRFRGRALAAPKGRATRPTSDRAREALFNVLVHRIGVDFGVARVADLFAGAGGLGFEALSRGAAHVTFVEDDAAALSALHANAAALGVEGEFDILRADATRLRSVQEGEACTLVFLDPPYGKGLAEPALAALVARGWLAPGAVVVVETGVGEELAVPAGFALRDERKSGAARLRILVHGASRLPANGDPNIIET
jgi:16S rRNA (guanine966-N2)-methyltransferase